MVVNSHNPEFGYELISVIPFAYWLKCNDMLTRTISGVGSEPFYYFSPDHEINPEPRSWYNVAKMDTPNRNIHRPELSMGRFTAPPYREVYANEKYHFDLVIYNRYNNEWPGVPELNRPINYFSLELLREIFTYFRGKILYCNVDGRHDLQDNSPSIPLGDWELVEEFTKYPRTASAFITSIHDLEEDYNTAQMMAFANCKLFLTLNGGGSILCSYFGGRNVIYTSPRTIGGRVYPRENQTGDFGYYNLFGGSEIVNVHTYRDVLENVL